MSTYPCKLKNGTTNNLGIRRLSKSYCVLWDSLTSISFHLDNLLVLVPLFFRFSECSKHWLSIEYRVHIWSVSPQQIYGDTVEMWTWIEGSNRKGQSYVYGKWEYSSNGQNKVLFESWKWIHLPQDSGLRTQTVYSTTKYMGIYKGDEIICGTIVALHGMTQMY